MSSKQRKDSRTTREPILVKRIPIGIDAAKDSHWVTAITDTGDIILNKRFKSTPSAIDELIVQIKALGGDRTIGIDMTGGIAALLIAMLIDAGETVVHVPGRSVNRARTGFRGGDNKSDPKDAQVIADQVRARRSELRELTCEDECTALASVSLSFP